MAIVRLLLFLALAMVGVALVLYAIKRDPRYLAFVRQVGKYTLLLLAAVLRSRCSACLSGPADSRGSSAAKGAREALSH